MFLASLPFSGATISRRAVRRREKEVDSATYSILFEITWQILLFIVLYCYTLSDKSFKAQNKEKAEEENTILPSDFALYQETVPAGVTENTILLFQVPDSVTSVDSLDLFVNISGTNYQITL